MDLLEADKTLLFNEAFMSMLDKLKKRRCYFDCVLCLEIPQDMWDSFYDSDRYVGFHCDQHKDQFHQHQSSARNCCDARSSSGHSEVYYGEMFRDVDSIANPNEDKPR